MLLGLLVCLSLLLLRLLVVLLLLLSWLQCGHAVDEVETRRRTDSRSRIMMRSIRVRTTTATTDECRHNVVVIVVFRRGRRSFVPLPRGRGTG